MAARLLTLDQAAEYLGMTPAALRKRVERRQIPFVRPTERTLRFDVRQLDKWIDANTIPAVR